MGTLPNTPDSSINHWLMQEAGVGSPPTEEQIAAELAEVLMASALAGRGPLGKLGELAKLLRVLRLVVKQVTARRDCEAYCLGAVLPGRKMAKLANVTASTMQGWINAGGKQSTDVES